MSAYLLTLGKRYTVASRVAYFDTSIYVCDPSGPPVYDNDSKTRTPVPEYAPHDVIFKKVRPSYFCDLYSPYEIDPSRRCGPNAINIHDMGAVDGHSIEHY